ncbi:MAG: SDR family NAD(P)-dependent oxidoreductase [Myxococcota bacterium]
MSGAALVVGAGSGTGAAVAKRFAREGLVACVARRSAGALAELVSEIESAGGRARAFGLDATDEEAVKATVETIENEVGPLEVLVYNSAIFTRASILDLTAEQYKGDWDVCAFAAFLCAREAALRMVERGRGTILFTGATASKRGGSHFAAFAGGKFALRALAESMARELGPKGIHVGHVIIDGLINVPRVRDIMPGMAEKLGEDGMVDPDAIADTYWHMHAQPKSTWTFEADVRPFRESF